MIAPADIAHEGRVHDRPSRRGSAWSEMLPIARGRRIRPCESQPHYAHRCHRWLASPGGLASTSRRTTVAMMCDS